LCVGSHYVHYVHLEYLNGEDIEKYYVTLKEGLEEVDEEYTSILKVMKEYEN
jgi:hypothetical protein